MNRLPVFTDKPYETQIILLISGVAILRLLLALVIDFSHEQLRTAEVITDSTLLFVFSVLAYITLKRGNFTSIHPIFGVALIILLGLNFLQFGGVHGNSRFNFYGGFFFVILLYTGRPLVLLLLFQCLLMIGLSVLTAFSTGGKTLFFITNDLDYTDFIFILIAFGALAFYLKALTESEVARLLSLSNRLNAKVAEAKVLNQDLVEQGRQLQQAQQHLEMEVSKKSAGLFEKQKAIERYIHLNTNAIQIPLSSLDEVIHTIEDAGVLDKMLLASHLELKEVVNGIAKTLQSNEQLTRTKIS